MSLLPPSLLTSLSTTFPKRPSTAYLVPLVVTTTLGHGGSNLGPIYRHATQHLPPAPSSRSPSPLPSQETNPRRRVVREMKEALVKSAILVGVPRVIEALLELGEVVEEGAKDDSFVREGLVGREMGEVMGNGERGLERVYRGDIGGIWEKMKPDMRDVKFFSKAITYGTFLTPYPPSPHSPDPLAYDPALLSVVTLSALIPQRTPREILWHLRGALRNGLEREEVERLQKAIEGVCEACGVRGVGEGMPRVGDVEDE